MRTRCARLCGAPELSVLGEVGAPDSLLEAGIGRVRSGDPALGLFPLLLAPEGGEVEEGVAAAQVLGAAGRCRVGVEHALAVTQESADARELGPIHRRPEVVVEVAAG